MGPTALVGPAFPGHNECLLPTSRIPSDDTPLSIHRAPSVPRPLALAGVAIAAAVLAASCAGSGFEFASSADGQAYFRVPSTWHLYPTAQMLRAQQLRSPGAGSEFKWIVGYDSSPHPSIE